MEIRTLYRYEREACKVTVSTEKPDVEYVEVYRIIADEDKTVTKDGLNFYSVVDSETKEGWRETGVSEDGDISDTEALNIIVNGDNGGELDV